MIRMIRARRWHGTVIAAMLLALPASITRADDPPVPVRVGSHEGYGRVVFDLPSRTEYRLLRQADRVTVEFVSDLMIGPPSAVPRNVTGISGGVGQAVLTVAPGTVLRDWRLGDRVVIDVWDRDAPVDFLGAPRAAAAKPPAVAKPAPASAAPAEAKPEPATPTVSSATEPPVPKQEAPAAPTAAPAVEPSAIATAPPGAEPSPAPIPVAASEPPAAVPPSSPLPAAVADTTAATREQPAEVAGSMLVIPSDAQLGIAAFRRGTSAVIVLDQRRAIDTASLRDDPVFGSASVQTLPNSTVIRIQLESGQALVPTRDAGAWRLTVMPHESNSRPIQATITDDRLALPANAPGSVVSLVDADTGAILLVGTQRRDGQAVPVQRRATEYVLLPTWIGVAVEPIGELVELRPTSQGFVLAGSPAGLALSPSSDIAEQLAHAVGLTRQFDFPTQPVEAGMQRLRRQLAEDAVTPQLARGPRRQAVARTMIALGLGPEAEAMLRLSAADDPHEAATADNALLTSIAALLARRPDAADGLADLDNPATDDIVLWRAVRLAQLHEGSPPAAAMFAATLPLLLTYPPEMRSRLLSLAAETLVGGGETAVAAALLKARADDPSLDLARAMLLDAQGDSPGALAAYDKLTSSRDRLVHARAALRAVELRLGIGVIDARQAVEKLESLQYAWRGDLREWALRQRLAELKVRSGAWRSALAVLRDSEALFPDERTAIHARLADTFSDLLRDNAADALPPLELVSLVEENTDLLPAGPEGDALQARLADRLLSLDLPKRAGPVLEKLMLSGNSTAARGGFGARLAALRLREGDAAGALAALDASTAADLPAELVEKRALLAAAATARRGDGERALATLGSLNSAAADEARATILERNNDWPGAQRALTDYVAKAVPADGKLDDAQRRAVLRLATATARAGNEVALASLREKETARMGTGPVADMFRLLTAAQVRGVGDLKRSGQETALARSLPAQLRGLQPRAGQMP